MLTPRVHGGYVRFAQCATWGRIGRLTMVMCPEKFSPQIQIARRKQICDRGDISWANVAPIFSVDAMRPPHKSETGKPHRLPHTRMAGGTPPSPVTPDWSNIFAPARICI